VSKQANRDTNALSNVRLVLAPLLGVTTSAFRRVFISHFSGLQEVLAPFILSTGNIAEFSKLTKDLAPEKNNNTLRIIPQLVSNQGHEFAAMATYLRDMYGYEEVNWNLGCAAGTTPSRLRGAGLLEHPHLIDRFLGEAFESFQGKISIKMRLGMKSPQECMQLLPILNRYPICEICMHPRIGAQHFSGKVDLDAFAAFCQGINHPILYNGDIRTASDATSITKRFPFLSGLMLGRGAIANPWLAQAILENKIETEIVNISVLKRFHEELLQDYIDTMEGGPSPVLGRMRELWPYWIALFAGQERQIRALLKAPSILAYRLASEKIFKDAS
jgi:tRNA-dihydrouridine synthase